MLGLAQAEHEESSPDAEQLVISKLVCSLVGSTETVTLVPGTLTHRAYGAAEAAEKFACNYGLNPEFASLLRDRDDLRIESTDEAGDIRIIRLPRHPFFLATLFQPERSSLKGLVHPLIRGFVAAAALRAE